MSDAIKYNDVDDDRWRLTPQALRDHVRALQKALAAVDPDFRAQAEKAGAR